MSREPNFWRPLPTLTFEDVEVLRDAELPELTKIDFKSIDAARKRPNGPSVAITMAGDLCALANAGGGRIVFGAETDQQDRAIKSFRGVPETELKGITSTIRNAAHLAAPPVDFELKPLKVPGADEFVVVVEARPTLAGPHQSPDGRYPMRHGDRCSNMSHSMIVASIRDNLAARSGDGLLGYSAPLAGKPIDLKEVNVFLGVHLQPVSPASRDVWDAGVREDLDQLLEDLRDWHLKPTATRRHADYTDGPNVLGRVGYNGNCWEVRAPAVRDQDGVYSLAGMSAEQLKQLVTGGPHSPVEMSVEKVASIIGSAISRLAHIIAAVEPSLRLLVRARVWTENGQGIMLRRGIGTGIERTELRGVPVVEEGELLGEALAGDLADPDGAAGEMESRFANLLFLYGRRLEPPEKSQTPAPPSASAHALGPRGQS